VHGLHFAVSQNDDLIISISCWNHRNSIGISVSSSLNIRKNSVFSLLQNAGKLVRSSPNFGELHLPSYFNMCCLRRIKDVAVRTLIHPPHPSVVFPDLFREAMIPWAHTSSFINIVSLIKTPWKSGKSSLYNHYYLWGAEVITRGWLLICGPSITMVICPLSSMQLHPQVPSSKLTLIKNINEHTWFPKGNSSRQMAE